jgi:hypothetical protein
MKSTHLLSHSTKISWPDVYLTAEADQEHFEDVSILSLKGYYTEKVYDQAIADVGCEDAEKLMKRVRQIINEGQTYVQEHVKISSSGMRVVLDCENVNNEEVLWSALDMLASAMERLDGHHGKVSFSALRAFTLTDVVWLNHH